MAAVQASAAAMLVTPVTVSGSSVLVTSGTTVEQMMCVEGTLLASGSGNFLFYGASEAANLTARFLDGGQIIVWNLGTATV